MNVVKTRIWIAICVYVLPNSSGVIAKHDPIDPARDEVLQALDQKTSKKALTLRPCLTDSLGKSPNELSHEIHYGFLLQPGIFSELLKQDICRCNDHKIEILDHENEIPSVSPREIGPILPCLCRPPEEPVANVTLNTRCPELLTNRRRNTRRMPAASFEQTAAEPVYGGGPGAASSRRYGRPPDAAAHRGYA